MSKELAKRLCELRAHSLHCDFVVVYPHLSAVDRWALLDLVYILMGHGLTEFFEQGSHTRRSKISTRNMENLEWQAWCEESWNEVLTA